LPLSQLNKCEMPGNPLVLIFRKGQ
jgi:hypothetical protein